MAFLRFRSVYCILDKTSVLTNDVLLVLFQTVRPDENRLPENKTQFEKIKTFQTSCSSVIAMSILFITMNPPYLLPNTFVPQYGKVLNMTQPSKSWYKYLGVPIESFTMFSYISSYLWTFGYALDICLQIYNKDTCVRMRVYQICFWVVPVWLVGWGQFGYLTGSNSYCSVRTQEIWHYMVCFVPLVCVFIVLPFIYILAYKQVRKNVKSAHACYTNAERELLFGVKKKFLLIWLVFVFCWLTNVVDGFCDLQIMWVDVDRPYVDENSIAIPHASAHFKIWMLEALVNPLQGFLNCLVYGHAKMVQCCRRCCRPSSMMIFSDAQTTSETSENFLINSHENLERSPLLQQRHHINSLTRTEGTPDYENQKQFVARLLGEPHIT
ncbi:hypothetical protein QZH41_013872 [Actinostola sp. cb2023]|nr:hypothetical protein QZH41_013872 [Actinostola sp. cb2023]